MDKSVDWRWSVYTALVCVRVPFYLPDRDKGQRRMRNEMCSYIRAHWPCDVRRASLEMCLCVRCQSQGSRAICHAGGLIMCAGAVWSALTLSDRHSPFIMSPRLRCHSGHTLTVSLTAAHTHLIALLLSYSVCVCGAWFHRVFCKKSALCSSTVWLLKIMLHYWII